MLWRPVRTIPHRFSDQFVTMRSRPEGGALVGGVPGPCIVDLGVSSDDDDDDDVVFLGECPAPFSHRASSRKGHTDGVGAVISTDLVILEEFDEPIELHFGARRVEKEWQKSSQNSSVVLDDDCCILDEDPDKQAVVKTNCGDDSDDLVMTGEVGQVACRDFPHARHLCVQFPFKTTIHTSFCSQCHCYVCDMLAPCSLWGDGTRAGDHCHASDKSEERWKLLRQYNKSHPTGCSNPSSIQQLLSPENTSAGKSDSGAQRCSSPAGLEICLIQSNELVAQCVSDLFGSDQGESTISKFFGALASTSSSRGFSQNPPVNTGNSESTSFRGLLGCHTGGSARSQYPLQISLNRPNRDLSSHPRRHHSQGVGVQSKLHKYLPRKDPRYPSVYRSHQSEGGGGCQPRKVPRRNASYYTQPPHSSSILERAQAQAASAACAAVIGRPYPAPTTAEHESFGGTVPNGNAFSSKDFLGELGASQTLFPFSNSGKTDEMRQQYFNVESASVCPDLNFGNATPLGQNEAGAFDYYVDGTGGSSNSVFAEPQSSRESENKLEGRTNYRPTSPSILLADYLLNSIPDFEWGD